MCSDEPVRDLDPVEEYLADVHPIRVKQVPVGRIWTKESLVRDARVEPFDLLSVVTRLCGKDQTQPLLWGEPAIMRSQCLGVRRLCPVSACSIRSLNDHQSLGVRRLRPGGAWRSRSTLQHCLNGRDARLKGSVLHRPE